MIQHTKVDENNYHAFSSGTEAIELPKWRGGGGGGGARKPLLQKDSTPLISIATKGDDLEPCSSSDSTAYAPSIPTTTLSATPTLPTTATRTLIFTRSLFWTDLTISLADSTTVSPSTNPLTTPLYHASTYEWSLTLPDILLYASTPSSPQHQLLAAAHFRWSRHARLGFGSSLAALNGKDTHDGEVAWETCRNTSGSGVWCVGHWSYDFSVPCSTTPTPTPTPTPESDGGIRDSDSESGKPKPKPKPKTPGRRNFRLLRTHAAHDGVAGWLGWASFRNYRLIDLDQSSPGPDVAPGQGKDVGVFLSDDLRSFTRVGELRLYEDLGGEEVETGVVLALAVVSEKATRRARRRGATGAGGGGGDGGGGGGG